MTIKGVLWRFALAYVVAAIAAGTVLNMLGIKGGTGVNVGLLAGCTLWVCIAFGKANGRYFTSSEKTLAVTGMIVIDLALQLVVMLATLSQRTAGLHAGAMLFALAFVGLLHAVAIYFFVGMAGKQLAKQGLVEQ